MRRWKISPRISSLSRTGPMRSPGVAVEADDRPSGFVRLTTILRPEVQQPNQCWRLGLCKDPRYFFSGAYVQYVQYFGDSQADDVLQERRSEAIGSVADGGLAQEPGGAAHVSPYHPIAMGFEYPPKATHELLMNAVIHRNYEGSTALPILVSHYADRIEIQNPGGLYGELTPEQFPMAPGIATRPRRGCEGLGFVNRFGRGNSARTEGAGKERLTTR